jgi:hypothetical protein
MQLTSSLGGRELKPMEMMTWTWTRILLWTPEILGIPVKHMTRGTLVQGHRYLRAMHNLDVMRIRMRAGLILDLIPVPTLDLIPAPTLALIPALTLALILVPIRALILRLPPWLWTGTILWETAGQPMVIHAGRPIAILERHPIVIHEGQLILIHEGPPSRSTLLPRDTIRMELFHLAKPGQFHVAPEMNLKFTSIHGLANQ